MNGKSSSLSEHTGKLSGIFGSVIRTTVKTVKNLPSRAENYIKRKIKEHKRKPKRDGVNKVYVLVGYATKEHIDAKINVERNLIILNRGMLLIIFFLLIFIALHAVTPYLNPDQYQDMFGISTYEEVTRNDPFTLPGSSHSGNATPTVTVQQSDV